MSGSAEWRPMAADDLPAIGDLSNRVHADYPERLAVLREKHTLFYEGCFTLTDGAGAVAGYCFSHPWSGDKPPALDSFLEKIPADSTGYFIHDLTLAPSMRGQNLAGRVVEMVVAVAEARGCRRITLVAVSGSSPFWKRMGFQQVNDAPAQLATQDKYGVSALLMQRAL